MAALPRPTPPRKCPGFNCYPAPPQAFSPFPAPKIFASAPPRSKKRLARASLQSSTDCYSPVRPSVAHYGQVEPSTFQTSPEEPSTAGMHAPPRTVVRGGGSLYCPVDFWPCPAPPHPVNKSFIVHPCSTAQYSMSWKDMLKMWLRYAQDICSRYAQDILKIWPRCGQGMAEI